MKTLIKYEFLKILRKKTTLMAMATSLLITAIFFCLPITQFQIYSQNGVFQRSKGIAYEKEQYANLTVPLTNEYVTETIREVQTLFKNPNNVGYDGNEQFLIEDAYWNGISPRENLLDLIARNYAAPNVSVGYQALTNLDVSDGADFYQARQNKIETILNDPSNGLSEAEKDYWRNMNNEVKEPFQYGYFKGWEVILSSFEVLIFAILAICIVIAPVFAGEYQAGTDAVILCGKYGKTKLPIAKIAAALLFGLSAFTLHVLVAFSIPLAMFGTDGWNLPLQINGTSVPYPLTFLEGTLINLGIIYLVLIAMISLTLFLSSKMKNPYFVLVVVIPILFIPIFFSPNGTSGIYNLSVFLTPYQALIPHFSSYLSYRFGSVVLDAFAMRGIIYGILTVVFLPLAITGFKTHQVA